MVSRLTFCLVLFCCAFSASAAVWYVDVDNGSGAEDGLSWATAFSTIQPAIDAASEGDEVWIAEGVYDEVRTTIRSTGNGDESVNTGSLLILRGLALYGGFAGTETARDQRDWAEHETVIDGFQSRDGGRAYHVVLVETPGPVVLDGLTIRGGKADRVFRMRHGGGVRVAQESTVTIANCTISQNEATVYGGGLVQSSGDLTVVNSQFIENRGAGGGIYAEGDNDLMIVGCTFLDNQSSSIGGGVRMGRGEVRQCVFRHNTTDDTVNGTGGGCLYSGARSSTACSRITGPTAAVAFTAKEGWTRTPACCSRM